MTELSNLSLYRGYSRRGIGEGAGRVVPHGEQYLAAEGPLEADAALLDAARAWMTLGGTTSDHEVLGARLEGWSYFRAGLYRFVARLTAAPERYDTRHAYFTHGRGWREKAFANGRDPGVLIGRTDAFELPWRTTDAQIPVTVSDELLAEPPAPADGDADTIIALLAHLYQAAVQRYPVIMGAPLSDFVAHSPLHRLVACARAALPLSIKRDLSLRVYTRHPELYLGDGGATLLVLPVDEAPNALAVARGATLLDRRGARLAGREAAEPFVTYAAETIRRATERHSALLRFTERVDARPWSRTGTTEAGEVGFMYVVAAASGSTADLDQFVRSLYKTLEVNPDALPRHELLTREDLQRCSPEVLQELILKPRSTPYAMAMRRLIEAAVQEKRTPLEPHLTRWWTSGSSAGAPERAERVLELQWHPDSIALLKQRPVSEVTPAFRTPQLISSFLRLADGGLLPSEDEAVWVPAAIELADNERLLEVTNWMLADPGRRKRHGSNLATAIEDLWVRDAPIPLDLARRLGGLWIGASTPPSLQVQVLQTELLYRADPELAESRLEQLRAIDQPEHRRQIVKWLADPNLRLQAAFHVPKTWDRDVADLLVSQETQRAHQSIDDLVRLLANGSYKHFPPDTQRTLFATIDDSMGREPERTTAALIRHRCWLRWQFATSFKDHGLRVCAQHWVRSPAWRDQIEPFFEDWKLVVRILRGSLAAPEFIEYQRSFPRIDGFGPEQQRDWLKTAADLVGLASTASQDAGLRPHALAAMNVLVDGRLPEHASELTRDVVNWAGRQAALATLPPELEDTLDGILQRHPAEAEPSETNRQVANRVRRRGLHALARALHPTLSEDNALVQGIVTALATGERSAACWAEIGQTARRALILNDVAQTLAGTEDAELFDALDAHGWPTLLRVIKHSTADLLSTGGYDGLRTLPALQLAGVLDDVQPMGVLAARLVTTEAAREHWSDSGWWGRLFEGLAAPRRVGMRHASDRVDSAIALLHAVRPAEAQSAFMEALAPLAGAGMTQESRMRIADVVTPFSPPKNHSGRQQAIADGRDGEFMILGARRLDQEALRAKKPASGWTRDTLAPQLSQRGGGMLAFLGRDGVLSFEEVRGGAATPVKHCALISVEGVRLVALEDISREVFDPSHHVLLPADAEAEARLLELVRVLDYLPSDRKLLVLTQIRRPSLEWRIDELERKVASIPGLKGREGGRGVLGSLGGLVDVRRWIPKYQLVGWAALVVLVLLLVMGVVRSLRPDPPGPQRPSIARLDPESVVAGSDAQTLIVDGAHFVAGSRVKLNDDERDADVTSARQLTVQLRKEDLAKPRKVNVVVVTPDRQSSGSVELKVTPRRVEPAATMDEARRALFDAMRESANERVGSLYRTHIEPEGSTDQSTAWAIVKLQLLKDGYNVEQPVLSGVQEYTATRVLFATAYGVVEEQPDTGPGRRSVRITNDDLRAMLAWTSCRAWKVSGLPVVLSDKTVMHFDDEPCSEPAQQSRVDNGALDAMNALVTWVREQ